MIRLDTVDQLLADLDRLGVELDAGADRLRYRPASRVDSQMLTRLRRHKADLLARLQSESSPPSRWARQAAALLATIADDEKRVGLRYAFEERAGIAEYHGGLNRNEAERLAWTELQAALNGG